MAIRMTNFSHSASVIIPNWNGISWLPRCLNALKNQSIQDFETIIVDNGSNDGSVSYIKNQHPDIKVVPLKKNYGFSVAANRGFNIATGKYIVLLNNDTIPDREWLSSLLGFIESSPEHVGSLASLMISMDNPLYTDNAGDFLDWHGFAEKRGRGEPSGQWTENEPVFSACGGAALFRREFFDKTGLFDEKFESYLEDIDTGLRGNLFGFSCIFIPSAKVLHKSHGSEMPSSEYVYHVTKNRLMLFFKNIPLVFFIRHIKSLFSGQIYLFFMNKHPLSSLRAYFYILRMFPVIVQDRRRILQGILLTNHEIELLLQGSMAWRARSGGIS